MDRELLADLRQSLDAVLSGTASEADEEQVRRVEKALGRLDQEDRSHVLSAPVHEDTRLVDLALCAIDETWQMGKPPRELPDGLKDIVQLHRTLSDLVALQQFTLSLARGDLSQSLNLRGIVAGALKSLQAGLRHLTRQAQQIAKGDFSHRVDFMGEFSEAFNGMVAALAQARSSLEQREADLLHAKRAAELANRVKNEFLGNMSHEVRTPLNAILGFSEILMDEIEDPQQREYLTNIHTSGEALLSLINDILDLVKIKAGRMEIEFRPVNIRRLIRDIELLFSHKLQKKGLEFKSYVNPRMPETLLLDEVRVRQVLIHLVGNAVKFTPHGCVKLTIDFKPSSKPEVKEGQNLIDLILEVEDTGIGIPPDHQERIFESFYQQEGHLARRFEGLGLGLAIAQKLVGMMNGTLSVESEVGRGSTFRVVLPGVSGA